tara:strand:+ start:246 stop:551 length:306 start_codon:yes stop_codon:yes gene_type:complete
MSLYDAKSHYSIGADSIVHRGKVTKTIVTNLEANNFVANMDSIKSKIGFIPRAYANRPDLISNIFYASPRSWWLLSMINNWSDPFENFNVGQRITIPDDAP